MISRIRNRWFTVGVTFRKTNWWFTVGEETCDISKEQLVVHVGDETCDISKEYQIFRIRNRKSPVTFSLGRVRGWDYRHSIRGEILDRLSYSNPDSRGTFIGLGCWISYSDLITLWNRFSPLTFSLSIRSRWNRELFEDGSVFFKMHSISSKSDRWWRSRSRRLIFQSNESWVANSGVETD